MNKKEMVLKGAVDPEEISATELRTQTRDILERARFQGTQFVVHTHGKPMAVVIGVEEFQVLKAFVATTTPQKNS